MEKFKTLNSPALPFPQRNVDTDLIIASDYLKTTKRTGLGKSAFSAIRYLKDGREDPNCVFNNPKFKNARILITGDNFGCGSSREHAAWALADLGIKAIIAPSFADIFESNAFKNGILTIKIEQFAIDQLLLEADKGDIVVDLVNQTIIGPNQKTLCFYYDPFKKHCMLEGLDEIGLTLQQAEKIDGFERHQAREYPWLNG